MLLVRAALSGSPAALEMPYPRAKPPAYIALSACLHTWQPQHACLDCTLSMTPGLHPQHACLHCNVSMMPALKSEISACMPALQAQHDACIASSARRLDSKLSKHALQAQHDAWIASSASMRCKLSMAPGLQAQQACVASSACLHCNLSMHTLRAQHASVVLLSCLAKQERM